MSPVRLFPLGIAAAAALLSVERGFAEVNKRYDGFWTIAVATVDGGCRARTLEILVRNGEVSVAGVGAPKADGAIGSNGRLEANIAQGEDVISVKGRISGGSGNGTWTSDKCLGQWTAQLRD